LRRSIILVSLVLLIAGCGDSKKASSGEGLTHAGYVQQADAVCQRADDAIAKLRQPTGVADLPAYAKDAAAIVATERDDLKALKAAPGDEVLVKELGSALDDVVRVANGLVKVAGGGNAAAINDFVQQNRAADERAKDLAKQLGSKVCAAAKT
jgi:hypothetical protein